MKICCMQVASRPLAVSENMARLERAAREANAEGCDLLITPEMYLTGYNIGADEVRRLAEPFDGPNAQRVGEIAKDTGIGILFGYPELGDGDSGIFNAVQLVDGAGTMRAHYRKTHLYGDVDRAQFSAGKARSNIVALEGWKVALAICFDIEFPELPRAYALDGADIILTPTANMIPYEGVSKRLVPARAEENGLFVVYANYCGTEGDFDYCGLSCICGPNGEDVARAGQGEALLMANLNRADVASVRQNLNYLSGLRPEVYGNITTGVSRDD